MSERARGRGQLRPLSPEAQAGLEELSAIMLRLLILARQDQERADGGQTSAGAARMRESGS